MYDSRIDILAPSCLYTMILLLMLKRLICDSCYFYETIATQEGYKAVFKTQGQALQFWWKSQEEGLVMFICHLAPELS